MSGLQTIQGDFQDYILADLRADAPRPAIAAAVREQFGLKAQDRLAIYHRAYRARLREALAEAYDKTWTYIGDEMFDELATGYIAAYPSHHPNLRWYGGGFAAHAAQVFADYPFIAELARFEWALGMAFDAADTVPLAAADLSAVAQEAWGDLEFGLHPSVRLLTMRWNAVALWQGMGADDDAELGEARELGAAQHWVVWRTANQPHFRSLPEMEAEALRGIGQGVSFGEVCVAASERAAAEGGETAADQALLALAGYLQNWLAQGLLTTSTAAW